MIDEVLTGQAVKNQAIIPIRRAARRPYACALLPRAVISTSPGERGRVPGAASGKLPLVSPVPAAAQQVDTFAEATGDFQWIHVDPEKAAAGPFGCTIAHGYLTLSLVPMLVWQIYRVEGLTMGVNYGAGKPARVAETVSVLVV